MNEGILDDVKAGVAKLTKSVREKIKSKAKEWAAKITEALSAAKSMPDDIKELVGAIKQGMKESGENFKLDDMLKSAKELGQTNYEEILDSDIKGPMRDAAAAVKSESFQRLHDVLYTEEYLRTKRGVLVEFGVTTAIGVGLALMGGLPLLFKGLAAVAGLLSLPNLKAKFESWEHATHAFEEKAVNYIVSDKLSYAIYRALQKTQFKGGIMLGDTEEIISFEDYTADKGVAYEKPKKGDKGKPGGIHKKSRSIRSKVDGLIYKGLLAFFLWQGIQGVLHAGASLIGIVEGTASAVKGAELTAAAAEVAAIARTAATV